jgi:hypothetical protein
MRWGIAYATAMVTGAFLLSPLESSAFLAPRRQQQTSGSVIISSITSSSYVSSSSSSSLAVGSMGWDNEDYLEALSRGPEAIDAANAQYQKYSRFGSMKLAGDDDDEGNDFGGGAGDLSPVGEPDDIGSVPGASGLSAEQLDRIKRDNDAEGASGGGARFQQMLQRAQQQAPSRPPPLPPPQVTPPSSPAGGSALPAGFENLSVEAQAALFRQLMMTPNPATDDAPPAQWPPAPGPRPPATGQAAMSADGRRIGRNRDADAIVNTSDVYFAQLKLDSSTRNQARYSGDSETADAVFANPAIKEIALHTNPYLEESRRQEQALLDTVAEEMLVFQKYDQQQPAAPNLSDRGISYKDKLRERKKNLGSTGIVPNSSEPNRATSSYSPSVASDEPIQQQTVMPSQKSAYGAISSPPQTLVPLPLPPPPAVEPRAPFQQAASYVESPTPSTDEASRRQDVRTLMGLLLKHRGGPGFGAGRITGSEAARFESLADTVMATLRSEATGSAQPSATATMAPSAFSASSTAMSGSVANPSVAATGGSAISQSPRVPVGDRINSMLSCIEGAVLMYRNAPFELQAGLLMTLRAALLSAANTCNEIVAGHQAEQFEAYRTALSDPHTRTSATTGYASSSTATMNPVGGTMGQASNIPLGERIASTLSLIEGAVQMYRNSPPELQGSVLVTLRAALLSAVGTFNEIVGTSMEPQQYDTYSDNGSSASSVPPPPAPTFSTPTQFYDAEVSAGTDDNSAFLENVYAKLKAAAGDGKMGLRDDLDVADAEGLANDISRMRTLLVDELNGTSSTSPTMTSSSSPSSAASKYQEMLAKARADKTSGN